MKYTKVEICGIIFLIKHLWVELEQILQVSV